MVKTTSAERMRKCRQKKREDPDFNIDKEREMERKRIAKIRKINKLKETTKIIKEKREYERLRKRVQRAKKKALTKTPTEDHRRSSNIKNGRMRREKSKKAKENEIAKLQLKVKLFKNENRCLKRKISKEPLNSSNFTLLENVSPSAKKRAKKRLSLNSPDQETVRAFRLDRIPWNERDENKLEKLVIDFLCSDENSIVTPDTKKANKGIRYRLASLKDLHQKFLVDKEGECSYSQFCRYVPSYIVKPKPEDWGTCLCMTCLNPELKLEAVKKEIKNVTFTLELVKNGEHTEELEKLCEAIKSSGKTYRYLEWSREKGAEVKNVTYHSKKNALSCSAKQFVQSFQNDINKLAQHARKFKSQYKRIREVKEFVKIPSNKAKLIRIDWSENVDLYQTRQEKSQYYTSISASVNTAVLYDEDGVKCFGTISDAKSHMASATWASLTAIFDQIDFSNTRSLYIASDSPTSQYRNKKNILLMKEWAVRNGVDIIWIYTESGHGKGPMDGVGSGIKRTIQDTIAYNPDGVIRTTNDLMKYLPVMPNINIFTYDQTDIDNMKLILPKNVEKIAIRAEGYGILNVHEIYCSKEKNCTVMWKALSSDQDYIRAWWNLIKSSQNQDNNFRKDDVNGERSDDDSDETNTTDENQMTLSIQEEHIGKFYCIYFDDGFYWGRLTKVFFDDEEDNEPVSGEFNFLRYTCGSWDFPKKEDKAVVNKKYIIFGPCTPAITNKNGYQFAEDNMVRQKYNEIKQKR